MLHLKCHRNTKDLFGIYFRKNKKYEPRPCPLRILLAVLLIGATVVGIAVYRYAKFPAVSSSVGRRVEEQDEGNAIHLAAAETGDGGTQTTFMAQ